MDVKTIHHSMVLPATPHEVYEALIDSAGHAAFTGEPASISRDIGGESTAYGDKLFFRNLELAPDRKIVQEWQSVTNEDWPRDHFSKVTYVLEPAPEGTKLTFMQEGVPAQQYEHYVEGWKEHYWTRLQKYFSKKRSL
jgi:activator of HSP90 ATPase